MVLPNQQISINKQNANTFIENYCWDSITQKFETILDSIGSGGYH
jgi:hypothetical protein